MKNIYIILLLLSLTAISSCSKWLDMRPKMEIRDDDMYASEDGYKSVLIGAYINMASNSLYGKSTTIWLPEILAQHWVVTSKSTDEYISKFDYTATSGVETSLSNIWLKYYFVIANLNDMLSRIDEDKSMFKDDNYNLIKGEATALRAFLHFEVLRLWGAVPALANNSELAIPYVKQLSNESSELSRVSYGTVIENIKTDLINALELLKDDPLTKYSLNMLKAPSSTLTEGNRPDDDFLHYRHNRFNYYAVKATLSRLYLWTGDKVRAAQYAKEIIDATDPDGKSKFILADESTVDGGISDGDLIHTSEHIFSIHNPKLDKILTPLFIEFGGLTQDYNKIKVAFETTINSDDIRSKDTRYWEEVPIPASSQKQNMFKKYITKDKTTNTVIPVIRLSEMYLIAIEALSIDEAATLFSQYRISRNMSKNIENEITEDGRMPRLEKEYRKEFYGEGQMFYFFKRHNYSTLSFPVNVNVNSDNYVLPIPAKQLSF